MQFVSNKITLTGILSTDAEDIVRYMQDQEISEGTSRIPFPYTINDARNWITDNHNFEATNGFKRNYAIRNETGKMLGCIGLHLNYGNDADKSEFGYWMGKEYRNQGIMTAAIKQLAQLAKTEYHLKGIEAYVFEFNIASQMVLLKTGFTLQQTITDYYKKDGQFISAMKFVRAL